MRPASQHAPRGLTALAPRKRIEVIADDEAEMYVPTLVPPVLTPSGRIYDAETTLIPRDAQNRSKQANGADL